MRLLFVILFAGISLNCFAQDASVELVKQGLQKSQMGKHEEALELYNQAIHTNPENLDAFVKRAYVNSILKNYQETVDDYNIVLEAKPNLATVYVSRGSA